MNQDLNSFSDEALVEYVRTSDQESYRELVHRYEQPLLRYATMILRHEHDARDVVQEAFIKAFRNLNAFNTKRKFSSWIYRIVHNEAMNWVRKRRREVLIEDQTWLSDRIFTETQDEALDRELTRAAIRAYLDKLPLSYREPLVLFYLEEKSYEEISDVLQMPVATVGTKIHRAKKMMQVMMTKGKKYE